MKQPESNQNLFSDMSNVLSRNQADRYSSLLARVEKQAKQSKQHSFDLMNFQPGQQILDVGSGTGSDLVSLAKRVAPGGRVFALDKSSVLLDTARKNVGSFEDSIEFCQGDVQAMPFQDRQFDACRAERVLQHVASPKKAISEMVRVTKSGGHIMVLDADYETMTLDASDVDVTRAVVKGRTETALNGRVGRELWGLCREEGLVDLHSEGFTFICTDYELANQIFELEAHASLLIDFDTERVNAWRQDLAQRGQSGRFFLASTGFLVVGRLA